MTAASVVLIDARSSFARGGNDCNAWGRIVLWAKRRHEAPAPVYADPAGLDLRAAHSNALNPGIRSGNSDVNQAFAADARVQQGAPAAELSFPSDSEHRRSGAGSGSTQTGAKQGRCFASCTYPKLNAPLRYQQERLADRTTRVRLGAIRPAGLRANLAGRSRASIEDAVLAASISSTTRECGSIIIEA